ncbi:MAG TPA: hypothetical protein VM925_13025 [Labilithrix sp.]|nr:hypothetical protein [Labilithrix sp.]
MKSFGCLAAGIVMAVTGCVDAGEVSDGETASDNFTETSRALDESAMRELASVGFTPEETKAVAESIAISKLLGVQSFVSEANDGYSASAASVRRESHGKHQGCLRAKVDVTTAPGAGAFQKGTSYPAWIRLSNGGAYQRDDKSKHISRGWGIKLLGVEGTPTGTHDFLFITSPRFFIHDIRHYPGFLKASGNGRLGFVWNLLTNMSWEEKQVIIHRLGLEVSNLLESPQYSAVPYEYGSERVKYAVAPCGDSPPTTPVSRPPPDGSSDDYLEEAMNATLESADSAKGVCYSFFIQRSRSESQDPIDNPTQAWEGAFEQVATITIPHSQQRGARADYRQNDAECERMAFDPFNTTDASRPLGKTNWTRKFVYAAHNRFRRVEMPDIYARWQQNHDDRSIPIEYRKELRKLRDPKALAPKVKDTSEPVIDDGFRKLGIVQ